MLDMVGETQKGDRNESRGTRKVSHPAPAGVNHGPVASPGESKKGAEKMKARIYQDGDEVVRVIPEGHILHDGFIDGKQVERFWVADLGSNGLTKEAYVRWVTEDRPGTLGQQVCEGLSRLGSTLMANPGSLIDVIRYEHDRAMRLTCRTQR